ncbi:hypothetical protein T484DRAFT_1961761 [Baffinella frigidus]|nr:hypothetical protein T484DRAFT_1961761 [Cryptophyta sp. CCMP2293]
MGPFCTISNPPDSSQISTPLTRTGFQHPHAPRFTPLLAPSPLSPFHHKQTHT